MDPPCPTRFSPYPNGPNTELTLLFFIAEPHLTLRFPLLPDPPGPPTIKVFPRAFALELTWKSSVQDVNNIKILDYRIKVSDGAILKEEFSAITRKSFTIEKLARNKTYVIEIQARNEVGYGETTNISAVTLLVGKMFFHIVATCG